MRKKVLAVLMSAAMAFSLAACGSGDSTKSNSDSGSGSDVKDVSLLVWSPSEDQSADYGEWLQTMCKQFNEEHKEWNITFTYGVGSEADVDGMILHDPEASADVFMFSNDKLATLVPAGAIAKIGGETLEEIKNTNSQAIVDSVSVDGSVYGVPFTTNTWFMYYDKSAFTEDEVNNLDKMLAKDKISFPLTTAWYLASIYVANGCTFFEDGTVNDAGIDFSGDKATQATEYLIDLLGNKNFVVDGDGAGIAGIRDGSIKAMFSGSWDYTGVKEALGENFGAKSLPTVTINGEDKQMMAFAGSKALGVNPNSKNPEVAVALAKYLGSAEAQKAHYEMRNIVPCNTELLEEEAIKNDLLVVAQNDTFENTSIIQPFVENMNKFWDPALNFGISIQNGEVTKDNAAAKTEELNKALNSSDIE